MTITFFHILRQKEIRCTCCETAFSSLSSQKEHYKSEWHMYVFISFFIFHFSKLLILIFFQFRYNLKARLRGETTLDEQQFNNKINGKEESVIPKASAPRESTSGHESDSSSSFSSEESEEDETTQYQYQHDQEGQTREPKVTFVLPDGRLFTFWKCVLETAINSRDLIMNQLRGPTLEWEFDGTQKQLSKKEQKDPIKSSQAELLRLQLIDKENKEIQNSPLFDEELWKLPNPAQWVISSFSFSGPCKRWAIIMSSGILFSSYSYFYSSFTSSFKEDILLLEFFVDQI